MQCEFASDYKSRVIVSLLCAPVALQIYIFDLIDILLELNGIWVWTAYHWRH